MKILGERLSLAMKVAGITQMMLAEKVNVTQASISAYCLGKREPSLTVLIKICKELGESADYLLGLVD